MELLRITVGDVDFDRCRLNVRAEITKSTPRYFYFDEETKRVLEEAIDYYGVKVVDYSPCRLPRLTRCLSPTGSMSSPS